MKQKELTNFQRRVYAMTSQIPRGKVTTYRDLGKAIGCRSPRAVGQALKRNPFAPKVPCHRVIAANGSLGGFHGEKEGVQIARKRRMLTEEGVKFLKDGSIDLRCLWLPSCEAA
ncbi:MAG: MGMT family protein [Chthoniobacterales bacterium]